MFTEEDTVNQITMEIARERELGFVDGDVPTAVNEGDAAIILGVKPTTLANWRCTGRYNLPFIKSGRLVRYRVTDLAQWIAKRRQGAED